MSDQLYAAHTLPGLEGVAWEEIKAELGAPALVSRGRGVVLFTQQGPVLKLLNLRTTEDVFAVVDHQPELSPTHYGLRQLREGLARTPALDTALAVHHELYRKRVKRITYRVVAQMKGPHDFRRQDAQQEAVAAIQRRNPHWKPMGEDAHLEFWLDIQERSAVTMLRLSDPTMRHRKYKLAHIPASLRPTLAAAMVFLSRPEPDDVFCDPMCGAGTILLERAYGGSSRAIVGGELDPAALAAAQANATASERIQLCRWDATRLPLAAGAVSKIATNLPFGKQIGDPNQLPQLYGAFLTEAARVLTPRGRAVLLTSERDLLEAALKGMPFYTRRQVSVGVLGQPATIFVLERAG